MKESIYDKNGLIFWTEEEIQAREMMMNYFVSQIKMSLKSQNSAFEFVRVEAPILTPNELINKNYTDEDVFRVGDVTLRPETTMGSFAYVPVLLNNHNIPKYRLPLVVWQLGKSFRNEQDQPTRFMRLKEFYQLEFQIVFAATTANDYSKKLYPDVQKAIEDMIGSCHMDPSDRLPDYSEETIDVICRKNGMEVCSMSKRKDLEGYKVIEVAIGMDRIVYNFLNKNNE
ncbi:MAG: aminoacyl--tRNA ligase-related protein [Nanoarchaeota archaeon]